MRGAAAHPNHRAGEGDRTRDQVLSRRHKTNPVLIGDSPEHWAAVVDGLAQAIVRDEVPRSLSGHQLFSIDLAG